MIQGRSVSPLNRPLVTSAIVQQDALVNSFIHNSHQPILLQNSPPRILTHSVANKVVLTPTTYVDLTNEEKSRIHRIEQKIQQQEVQKEVYQHNIEQQNINFQNHFTLKEREIENLKAQIIQQRLEGENALQNLQQSLQIIHQQKIQQLINDHEIEKTHFMHDYKLIQDRNHEYGHQLESQDKEIQQLNHFITNLQKENESLKNKAFQFEKELNNYKIHNSHQLKRNQEIEVQEIGLKFQQEKEQLLEALNQKIQEIKDYQLKLIALQAEKDKAKQQNNEKDQIIQQLNLKIKNMNNQEEANQLELQNQLEQLNTLLGNEKKHYDKSLKLLKQKIEDQDQKIIDLQNQILYLTDQNSSKESQFIFIKNQLSSEKHYLEEQVKLLKIKTNDLDKSTMDKQVQLDKYKKETELLEEELDQLKKQSETEIASLTNQLRSLEKINKQIRSQNNQLEDSNATAQREKDKFENKFESAQGLLKELEKKSSTKESEFILEIEDLTAELENLRKVSLTMRDLEIKFGAERTVYKNKIESLELKVNELLDNNKILSTDNESLYQELTQQKNELDLIRIQCGELVSAEYVHKINKQIEELKQNKADLEQKIQFKDSQAANIEQKNRFISEELEQKLIEIQQLNELLAQRRKEQEETNEKLSKALKQLNNNQQIISEFESRDRLNTQSLRTITNENASLHLKVDQLKTQIAEYENLMNEKNQELIQKIKEVDQVKSKFEEAVKQMNSSTPGVRASIRMSKILSKDQISQFVQQQKD